MSVPTCAEPVLAPQVTMQARELGGKRAVATPYMPFLHGLQRAVADGDGVLRPLVVGVDHGAVVVGLDVLEQVRLVVLAIADEGGDVVRQLDRREQVIRLADGGGDRLAVRPLEVVGLGVFGRGERALRVGPVSMPVEAAETELRGDIVDRLSRSRPVS